MPEKRLLLLAMAAAHCCLYCITIAFPQRISRRTGNGTPGANAGWRHSPATALLGTWGAAHAGAVKRQTACTTAAKILRQAKQSAGKAIFFVALSRHAAGLGAPPTASPSDGMRFSAVAYRSLKACCLASPDAISRRRIAGVEGGMVRAVGA